MRGSRRVLVKVVLFQLDGRGNPLDGAMPSFIADSNSFMLGISNEVSFVSKFFWEGGKGYTSYWGAQNIWRTLYLLEHVQLYETAAGPVYEVK